MVRAMLVDRPLNDGFQPVLILVGERNEAEWLQAPGKRAQHFRRTQHHSSRGQKHQFCSASGVDGVRHGKQTASQRNDFQFAWDTPPIIESKDS
jgi:hypothetical protein